MCTKGLPKLIRSRVHGVVVATLSRDVDEGGGVVATLSTDVDEGGGILNFFGILEQLENKFLGIGF